MRATLTGSAGPVAGREYNLDQPLVTIGRRDENAIVIKDPTVSRKHAEIHQEGNDFILTDKGSTSGTLVNGEVITGPRRLHDGDTVTIGNTATFAVRIDLDDAATVAFSAEDLPGAVRERTIIGTPLPAFEPPPPPPPPQSQPQPNVAAFDARSFADRPAEGPSFAPPPAPPPPVQNPFPAPPTAGPAPAQPPPQQPFASGASAPSNFGGAPRGGGDDLDGLLLDLDRQAPPPTDAAPYGGTPNPGTGAGNRPPPVGSFTAPLADAPPIRERTRAELDFSGPPPGIGAPQGYAPPPPQPAPVAAPVPAATGGSRRGLVIGLTIAAIVLFVAILIVALLLFRVLTS